MEKAKNWASAAIKWGVHTDLAAVAGVGLIAAGAAEVSRGLALAIVGASMLYAAVRLRKSV